MTSVTSEVNQWYELLKNQKLEGNDKSTEIWNKYKSDLEVTKSLVSLLPKKMTHKVMVPIGSKALMPGQIVHTNEFLVNLGETWFVKRTASQTQEICDRKIKRCVEMLEKLQKEKELIESKSTLPGEQDAFGNEERPEIIEFVTEEENEEWKRQHRIKEKEYRQKLANLRAQEKKQIQTEEDLWEHLDRLELQEELEDELNRLNTENDDDDDEEYFDQQEIEYDGSSNTDINNKKSLNEKSINSDLDANQINNIGRESVIEDSSPGKTKKKKVSFDLGTLDVREMSDANDLNDNDENEPLRLIIKFSSVEPATSNSSNSVIQSPGEIYQKFLESGSSQSSILKSKVNPNKEKEVVKFENEKLSETSESDGENEKEERKNKFNEITSGIVFKDVTEKNSFVIENSENIESSKRKISKFKASRMKTS